MCGIVGGISFDGSIFPSLKEMNESIRTMKYRGPDFCKSLLVEERNSKAHFGHTRLSIIDLSVDGNQPMIDSDNGNIISFNGEIYNYKDLRDELVNLGCSFNSDSDTEVILKAYSKWGISTCLDRLDGMFAFAIFDRGLEEVVLARDRFGKKPLYFWHNGGKLMFSSDIRCFEDVAGVNLTINLHALGYYFSELSTPERETIWNEIYKLRPGHFIIRDSKGIGEQKSYWNLYYTNNCKLSAVEIQRHTSWLLSKSIKKRLIGDVNVAALLSGGIDSSLMVAKMVEQSKEVINTYSVGFENQSYNELPYAREVANKFKTNHKEIIVTIPPFEEVDKIINEFGEPFADSSMIPTYLISKVISEREKVVLGGDGGDELFAGYESYYFAYKYDRFKKASFLKPFVKFIKDLAPTYRNQLLYKLLSQNEKPIHSLLNRKLGFDENQLFAMLPDIRFSGALNMEHIRIWNEFKQSKDFEFINVLSSSLHTRLVNDYLVKLDRASMYASLEMRSPFLDKELAEFASTLRPSQLIKPNGPKSILKGLARSYFSYEFINREKMGFRVPIGEWFRGGLGGILKDRVLGGKQSFVNLNYSVVEKIIKDHEFGYMDHSHRLWSLYVFHIWAQAK